MKVSVNDKEIFTLTDIQKKVICDAVPEEIFEEDMCRRLNWVLLHKYEHTFDIMKKEWEPKLREAGISMIPTDNDALAELIFSQPDYKNRTQKDIEFQNS